MSLRRTELQRKLEALLGSRNVYFQPPTGTKLNYPAIVYKLATANDVHADNKIYRRLYRYSLTYITKNPDDPMTDKIDDMQYCSFDTAFSSDNLNHYVYTIWY
jgi:hypothetical protein